MHIWQNVQKYKQFGRSLFSLASLLALWSFWAIVRFPNPVHCSWETWLSEPQLAKLPCHLATLPTCQLATLPPCPTLPDWGRVGGTWNHSYGQRLPLTLGENIWRYLQNLTQNDLHWFSIICRWMHWATYLKIIICIVSFNTYLWYCGTIPSEKIALPLFHSSLFSFCCAFPSKLIVDTDYVLCETQKAMLLSRVSLPWIIWQEEAKLPNCPSWRSRIN